MKKRLIPIVLFLSLVGLGGLSLVSIHNLQGNARVINYTGVVRGATQRLVKEELKGRTDDALLRVWTALWRSWPPVGKTAHPFE